MRLVEQQKKELRSSFRQRSDLFQAPQSAFLVERFTENLNQFLKGQSGTWAAFKSDGHEPRLDLCVQMNSHIRWVYPRIREGRIEFVASHQFSTGKYGIQEPVGDGVVDKLEIGGYLVPGIAFDRTGTRLGRGKGYYDQALDVSMGLKVGLCFSFQIFDGLLPSTSLDVKMDRIISDQGDFLVQGF